jgi:hypothetical protein
MPRTRTTFSKTNPPKNGFKPGVSGNPGGRTPTSLLEPARKLTQEALATIAELMRASPDQRIRLDAASELLSRGWGRPAQAVIAQVDTRVVVGGIDAPPRTNSVEEAEQWLARRRRELAALTGEAKPQPPVVDGVTEEPPSTAPEPPPTPAQQQQQSVAPIWTEDGERVWHRQQEERQEVTMDVLWRDRGMRRW